MLAIREVFKFLNLLFEQPVVELLRAAESYVVVVMFDTSAIELFTLCIGHVVLVVWGSSPVVFVFCNYVILFVFHCSY
jgi:hypothetical protein